MNYSMRAGTPGHQRPPHGFDATTPATTGLYVQYSGQVTGPHDSAVLRKGVGDGHLTAASLVAETPHGPFVHLETKPEFAMLFRPKTTDADLQRLAEQENLSVRGGLAMLSTAMRGLAIIGAALVFYGKVARSLEVLIAGLGLLLVAVMIRVVLKARAG